jgi:hypothetical protein
MKKIISIICLLGSIALFQGCKDYLEPEVKTDIFLANFGNSPTEATLLLNQAYVEVRDEFVLGSGYGQHFATDFSVANPATTLARSLVARMSYDATDSDVFGYWSAHYKAVSRPNLIIERATTNTAKGDISAADKIQWARIDGEARFLRAIVYFNLVRMFRNAPIIEKFFTTFSDIADVSNSPGDKMKEQEAKLYDFIIADLTKANAQLPESPVRGTAGKFAAQALLAKVHLTRATIAKYRDKTGDGKADYEAALTNLNTVINSKQYALKTYFPDNFIRDKQHTGNNEALFMLEYNELDNIPSNSRVGVRNGFPSNNTGSNVEVGGGVLPNDTQMPNDFGWSVFDFNSPGDIVRRFWTFEEAEFRSFNVNGVAGLQNSAADCPTGENCEIFLKTVEPYPFTRPYWFETVNDANVFRFNPGAADVITEVGGKTSFSIIWGNNSPTAQSGMRNVKFRRNPITQPNYTLNTYDGDLPVIRYAEVLLMYAEVVNELVGSTTAPAGNTLTATAAVNLLRDRARNFAYYPNMTVDTRIIPTGPYKATYGDIFKRQAKVGSNPAPALTANAADTLAKYYNEICAFKGLRETPAAADIRSFKNFPATANYVPDFPTTLTQDQFREQLLDERWRELAGEQNQRWYDLTRYGILVSRVQQYKTLVNPLTKRSLALSPFGTQVLQSPNPKFEYFPIPRTEIDRNNKLFQNAGF